MCDGDKSLVIKDKLLTKVAKRNMTNIVPLYYNMHKAKGDLLTPESIYQGMSKAFTGGNIGPISNNISKIWNCGKIGQEQLDVIKRLCCENNQVIDYAKTLWRSTPPKEVAELIKSYTKAKVPNFFIYAKDKTKAQVEEVNNSTMNRISESIPSSLVKYSKTIGKLDYKKLMSNEDIEFDGKAAVVIDTYNYWNRRQNTIFSFEDDDHVNQEDMYAYQRMRQIILDSVDLDTNTVVNILVKYLYTVKPNSTKKLFWACFGGEVVENLKKNTQGLGNVCEICGKRFKPNNAVQKYCGPECSQVANIELTKAKKFDTRK